MGKYSKDLDSKLVAMVEAAVAETNLEQIGVRVEAIKMNKSKGVIGEVLKGNDLMKLFNQGDDIVAIALFEEAFMEVNERTRQLWIELLVSQAWYDIDKDKLVITKPELNIPVGMYRKYGAEVVDAMEVALMTVESINERKKAEKQK